MRRFFLTASFLFCLLASSSFAQTTVVTGTVKDINGIPYAGASIKAQLVLAGGAAVNGQPTVTVTGVQACRSSGFGSSPCQVPFQGTAGPFTLDSAGSFSQTLQDNTLVTPASTQWLFSVTISPGVPPPLGTGPQACSATLTITGASQSVSTSLASCPALQTTAVNSPIPPSQAQGPTYNVRTYGATGDTQKVLDGVTAGGGGHTVTSASAPFVVGDLRKKIVCAGAGTSPQMPISNITVFNSATQVTTDGTDIGAGSGLRCIWYTKDDTTAFTSANTAATPAIASKDPNVGPTLGGLPGSVYCPEGGYAVSARIFHFAGAGSSIGPNFIGAGKNHCIIYTIPGLVDPGDGFAVLMDFYNGIGGVMKGFTVDGIGYGGGNFAHPIVQFSSAQQFVMDDVNITNISTNQLFNGTLDFLNSANGVVSNVFLQGGGGQGTDFACGFSGLTTTVFRNLTCSNHNRNGYFANNGSAGARSVFGDNAPTFIDVLLDECGSASQNCYFFDVRGAANFFGGWVGVGNTGRYAMDLNTSTSRVWLTDVNCGQYGSTTNNSGCATLAAGAAVYTTNSTLRSNGTFGIFNGPSTAFVYDIGGNDWLNCVSAVCSAVTAATYGTLGFTGGLVPKATVTHTPNTCYAVTGNLLATAQNLCTFTNDQNYQIVNVTAQSGGTTPANSACATPPVITFSDGTRTATLTMTTAKTQWSSAVDTYTGANQVFATGTTLTISIGANTCATPPVNVSVSYVLQSVLNP